MADRIERAALAALIAFTIIAIAGFAAFGAHPELLRGSPLAQRVYGAAFTLFARGQVLLAAVTLGVVLVRRAGAAWLSAAAAVYAASLLSELAGTTVGLPFGAYAYTDGLGPKWFGHVPMLIPLSWFVMAVPSFAIARAIAGPRPARRIGLASLVLLSWDLVLDPAMSFATKYWVWGATGPYYGMPWLNLFGWYVTGVVLMLILTAFNAARWVDRLPRRWIIGFYLTNIGLAIGLCAAAGLHDAVIAGLLPLALCVLALVPGWRGRALAVEPT